MYIIHLVLVLLNGVIHRDAVVSKTGKTSVYYVHSTYMPLLISYDSNGWRWFEMFFNTVLCSSLKTGKTSGLPWFFRIEHVSGCGSALLMIWWSYLPKIQNGAPDSYPLSINRSGPRDSFIIRHYSFFTWMASLISCSNWDHLCFVVHKLRMNFMWCNSVLHQ